MSPKYARLTIILAVFIFPFSYGDTNSNFCLDSPVGWKDSRGNTCEQFSSSNWCSIDGQVGPSWDSLNGSISEHAVDGVDAFQACCACGGGLRQNEESESPPETDQISDAEKELGNFSTSQVDDVADQLEEALEGYVSGKASDLASEIAKAIMNANPEQDSDVVMIIDAPSYTCVDSPENWQDSRGWTCNFFASVNWCTPDGKVGAAWDLRKGSISDFAVDGVDALQACCACGGGVQTQKKESEDSASREASQTTNANEAELVPQSTNEDSSNKEQDKVISTDNQSVATSVNEENTAEESQTHTESISSIESKDAEAIKTTVETMTMLMESSPKQQREDKSGGSLGNSVNGRPSKISIEDLSAPESQELEDFAVRPSKINNQPLSLVETSEQEEDQPKSLQKDFPQEKNGDVENEPQNVDSDASNTRENKLEVSSQQEEQPAEPVVKETEQEHTRENKIQNAAQEAHKPAELPVAKEEISEISEAKTDEPATENPKERDPEDLPTNFEQQSETESSQESPKMNQPRETVDDFQKVEAESFPADLSQEGELLEEVTVATDDMPETVATATEQADTVEKSAETSPGSAICNDKVENWKDLYGFNCDEYKTMSLCNPDGSYGTGWEPSWGTFAQYAVDSLDATDICCNCGYHSDEQPTITTAPEEDKQKSQLADQETHSDILKESSNISQEPVSGLKEDDIRKEEEAVSTAETTPDLSFVGKNQLDLEAPSTLCKDKVANWKDLYGYSCKEYGALALCNTDGSYGSGWDPSWGSFSEYGVEGLDATEVCCGCGYIAEQLIQSTNAEPIEEPQQLEETKNQEELANTPSTFSQEALPQEHLSADTNNLEISVQEESQTNNESELSNPEIPVQEESESNTESDLKEGQEPCRDKVENWKDRYGYNCNEYETLALCNTDGSYGTGWDPRWGSFSEYAVESLDATEVCCSCGYNIVSGEEEGFVKASAKTSLSQSTSEEEKSNSVKDAAQEDQLGTGSASGEEMLTSAFSSDDILAETHAPTTMLSEGNGEENQDEVSKVLDEMSNSISHLSKKGDEVLGTHYSTYHIPVQHLTMAFGAYFEKETNANAIVLADEAVHSGAASIPKGLATYFGVMQNPVTLSFTLDVSALGTTCNGYGFALMHQPTADCVLQSHDPTVCTGLNFALITDEKNEGGFVAIGDDSMVAHFRGGEKFVGKATKVEMTIAPSTTLPGNLDVTYTLDGENPFELSYYYPVPTTDFNGAIIFGGLTGRTCSNKFSISEVFISTAKELSHLEDSLIREYLALTNKEAITDFFNTLEEVQEAQLLHIVGQDDDGEQFDTTSMTFYIAALVGIVGFLVVLKMVILTKNCVGRGNNSYELV